MPEEETVGINGADVLFYVETTTGNFEALAGQRGASRETSIGTIDVSAKMDDTERFIPGRKSSSMSFDGLWAPNHAAYKRLKEAADNRETVVCRLMLDGEPWEDADGFLTSISESFPDNDAATFSANFQVSGAWRPAPEPEG